MRKPVTSHSALAATHKKMKQDALYDEESTFLLKYRRLEDPLTVGTSRYEETKRLIKQSQVSAAVGVRGQNKVSMLAKDLARQFSGEADNQQVHSCLSVVVTCQAGWCWVLGCKYFTIAIV